MIQQLVINNEYIIRYNLISDEELYIEIVSYCSKNVWNCIIVKNNLIHYSSNIKHIYNILKNNGKYQNVDYFFDIYQYSINNTDKIMMTLSDNDNIYCEVFYLS